MCPVLPSSDVGPSDMPAFMAEQGNPPHQEPVRSEECLKLGDDTPTTTASFVANWEMKKISSRSTVADEESESTPEPVLDEEDGEVSEQTTCHLENASRVLQNLYLGGKEAVQDVKSLELQGICAVVCCSRDHEIPDEKFVPGLEYMRVDVEDMGREPIGLFFPETTEFIHTQLLQERPVLVHCKAGVSRSASILLAYLMEYRQYSLIDAFRLLIRLRPEITPNPGFMTQLVTYEKEVHGASTPSIDIRKYVAWMQASERCPEPDLNPDDC